jgi:hypothetical protein
VIFFISHPLGCLTERRHSRGPGETWAYAFWLLSDATDWLPTRLRNVLHRGMGEWRVWPWVEYSGWRDRDEYGITGALAMQLSRARERGKP